MFGKLGPRLARAKVKKTPNNIRDFIASVLKLVPKHGRALKRYYVLFWNPINYLLVGGIGVLINMAVWALLLNMLPGFPWFLTNTLAILAGWGHNWAFSVGPYGWVWGFKKRGQKSAS